MSRCSPSPNHPLYDAYCFSASPTYGSWCLLTIADVHNLKSQPTFQEQGIYFYLNHPIKFVQLVGVVVTFEVDEKWIRFVLDDGSGAAIEVRHKVLQETEPSKANDEPPAEAPPNLEGIDIGSVVKVKGQIRVFWNLRTIDLKRISIVRDTNEEVHNWSRLVQFRTDILSKPWFLDERARLRLLAKANGQSSRESARRKRHGISKKEHREKKRRKSQKILEDDVTEERGRSQGREPSNNMEKGDDSKSSRKRKEVGKDDDKARTEVKTSASETPLLVQAADEKAHERFVALRRRIAEMDNLDALGL